MDTFSPNNLIKVKTRYKSASTTILDIMFMNKMRIFQKTSPATTDISDCHEIIITCLKAHFKKLLLKKIVYRGYKNFNENTFLYGLDQNLIQGKFYSQKNSYDLFTETFKSVDHHAPLPLDWNSPCRGEGASHQKFLQECVNEKNSTERRS